MKRTGGRADPKLANRILSGGQGAEARGAFGSKRQWLASG